MRLQKCWETKILTKTNSTLQTAVENVYLYIWTEYWSHWKKFRLKQQSYHGPVNKIADYFVNLIPNQRPSRSSRLNDLPWRPVVLFVPSLPLAQWCFLQGALLVPSNEATSSSNLIGTPIQPCGPRFTTSRLALLSIHQLFNFLFFSHTWRPLYMPLRVLVKTLRRVSPVGKGFKEKTDWWSRQNYRTCLG